MISILIPVFNTNIIALVDSLHHQVRIAEVKAEILVMDDASSDSNLKSQNREFLSRLDLVRYIELPSNKGRNLIRHQLADAAKYDRLIFLDADSNLPDEYWLQRYITAMQGNAIIIGGRVYQANGQDELTLHFHYSYVREQVPASDRNRFPYRSFLACNFCISRQQFQQLIIDKWLHGYGHEDTFMGLQFDKLKIPVLHIDNPVFHLGIDDDLSFIKKQRDALQNLQYLFDTYGNSFNFSTDVKLIRVFEKIRRAPGHQYLLHWITGLKSFFLRRALQSHHLFWLDCWKLAEFHQLYRQGAP